MIVVIKTNNNFSLQGATPIKLTNTFQFQIEYKLVHGLRGAKHRERYLFDHTV